MTGGGVVTVVDRLRTRYGWLDRVMRANEHYNACRGNLLAAGLSYYTIFAMFPLLMVGFSVGGFLLSRRPGLLAELDHRVRASIPGDLGQQVVRLMDSAIASRTSVGVIGLVVAGWAGLNWMAKLREALSEVARNDEADGAKAGFVHTKLSDVAAMVSAFVLTVATIGLTAAGDPKLVARALRWLGVPDFELLGALLRGGSLVMSLLVSWLLFTWMIGRLPREPIGLAGSMRAGLIAAVGFELFKQAGSAYLQAVVSGPAGAAFGPVLGLLVFAYVTARLVLFATAWAAVAPEAAEDSLPAQSD